MTRAGGRSGRLGLWDLGHLTDAASVILSELVTNAVKSVPGGEIEVGVRVRDGWLRLEVTDGSPRLRRVPDAPSLTSEGGRGLFVVEALADKVGVEPRSGESGTGKTVWAMLPCDAAGVAAEGEPRDLG